MVSPEQAEQRRSWEQLALAWERWAGVLKSRTQAVDDWMIAHLEPRSGMHLLALAAGPGDVCFDIAPMLKPDGKVLCTDLNPAMLEAASRRAAQMGMDNIEFRPMDAQQIDARDSSFDLISFRFGPMLLPEPHKCFAESLRVLKPGGRMATVVFAGPDRNPGLTMMGRAVMESGRPMPGGNPFEPGGVFSISTPDHLEGMFTAAGFAEVEVEELDISKPFASFADYWQMQSEIGGPVAVVLSQMSESERAEVRSTLEGMTEPFQGPAGLSFPAWAIVGSGKKPGGP